MNIEITPVNHEAEEEGSWADYMGVGLLIARGNNDIYKREFRRLSKPHKRQIDKGNLDNDIAEGILIQSAAKGILKGWKNFIVDGKELPFSVKNATSLLENDSDCFDFIREYSDDLDNFIKEEEEETLGE